MYDTPDFAFDALWRLLLTLTLAVPAMVLMAFVAERFFVRAAIRRVLWQAVLLGLAGFLVFELTGAGYAVSALLATSHDAGKVLHEEPRANRPAGLENPGTLRLDVLADVGDPAISPPSDTPRLSREEYGFTPGQMAMQPGDSWSTSWEMPSDDSAAQSDAAPSMQSIESTDSTRGAGDAPAAALSPVPVPPASESRGWMPGLATWILALLWGVGACLFVGRTALAQGRLSWLKRQWLPLDDPEMARMVEVLARRIGMKRSVRVCTAVGLPTPVAFGVFHPTVLLPADFSKRFSRSQQQVILAHELAHLAANDPAWLLTSELMTALVWWHPVAHVAHRRLLAASEQAADEASVLVPDGPDLLAGCLVKLGRRMAGRPRFGWVAAEGSGLRSGLARRVQRLLKLTERPGRSPNRVPHTFKPVAVVLLMALTILCTLWAHPKASFAKGEETMNVMRVSWRQSLAAAALAAFLGPMAIDVAADDDGAVAPPKPAQIEDISPVDALLLAERGEQEDREARPERDGDRREGDGDRREGDRRDGDRREGDGDRRDGDRREGDGDRRERGPRDGDARQRGDGPQREQLMGQGEELRRRAEQLERERAELREGAEREARELEEHIRGTQQEREENARHIAELERADGDEAAVELDKARKVQRELAERAEDLERELNGHREGVQRRSEELDRAFGEVHSQLERIERALAERNPERLEAMRRLESMGREIRELREAGKNEQAQALEREMAQLHERLAAPHDGQRPEARQPQRREGAERLEAMMRELRQLQEAGREEAAAALERGIHELQQRLAGGQRDGDRPGPPAELRVRIGHLRAAMESLLAAGLHDQAEQVGQQIERLMGEFAPGRPLPPEARPRGPRPEGRPQPGGEIFGQLRGEIEQLRRENEEIRRMMNELREAQERFLNELRERR